VRDVHERETFFPPFEEYTTGCDCLMQLSTGHRFFREKWRNEEERNWAIKHSREFLG